MRIKHADAPGAIKLADISSTTVFEYTNYHGCDNDDHLLFKTKEWKYGKENKEKRTFCVSLDTGDIFYLTDDEIIVPRFDAVLDFIKPEKPKKGIKS